jgi:hypothetical protein
MLDSFHPDDGGDTFLRNVLAVTRNRSVLRLLVTANDVPSSPSLTRMMEAIRSSETSVLSRATRRNIPEYGIVHSHRLENLKPLILQIFLYVQRTHLG